MRNHGLLMAGTSIPEAFHMTYMLERACAAQVAALSGGQALVYPPEEVCRHTSDQFLSMENDEHYAWMWESALRLIENDRPDYRS
jgi:ribulose-5-phosphate 4-epimerase/fuculose-1-phosphate aldolase